jgi:hypothetical protein
MWGNLRFLKKIKKKFKQDALQHLTLGSEATRVSDNNIEYKFLILKNQKTKINTHSNTQTHKHG